MLFSLSVLELCVGVVCVSCVVPSDAVLFRPPIGPDKKKLKNSTQKIILSLSVYQSKDSVSPVCGIGLLSFSLCAQDLSKLPNSMHYKHQYFFIANYQTLKENPGFF